MLDTERRAQAINPQESFIVQAPAGSGKTSLLTHRYIKLLLQVSQPQQILALTFTRKASSEMRARVIFFLEMAQSGATVAPHLTQIKLDAQKVLERDLKLGWNILLDPAQLKIMTFDALCGSLVQKMPVLSGFGAKPSVYDNPYELYEIVSSNFIQKYIKTATLDENFKALFLHVDNDLTKLKKLFCSLLATRDKWLSAMLALKTIDLEKMLIQNISNIITSSILELQTLLNNIDPNLLNNTKLCLQKAQIICAKEEDYNFFKIFSSLVLTKNHVWRKSVNKNQGFSPQMRECKQDFLEILAILSEHDFLLIKFSLLKSLFEIDENNLNLAIITPLIKILPMLVAEFLVVCKNLGKSDFTEIAIAAGNLLNTEHEISDLALHLDYSLNHLLIDEFQDTSILQFDLLSKMVEGWQGCDYKSIFIVGDPMQSIYRFRQAEVSLFLAVKQHGINQLKPKFLQLTTNFRSTQSIVNFINAKACAFFPKNDDLELAAISYTNSYAASYIEGDSVSCVHTPNTAQTVLEIIQNSTSLELAILVRSRAHAEQIIQMLRTQAISFEAIDLELLANKQIVQDILAIITSITHPQDNLAWYAILRSPLVGLNNNDLYWLNQQYALFYPFMVEIYTSVCNYYQQQVDIALTDNIILDKFIENSALYKLSRDSILRLWLFIYKYMAATINFGTETLEMKLNDLLQKLHVYNIYSTEKLVYVNAVLDIIAKTNTVYHKFNPDFFENILNTTYVNDSYNTSSNKNLTKIYIMTIHKAKGLEFDEVILPYLDKTPANDNMQLVLTTHYLQQFLISAIAQASTDKNILYDFISKLNHIAQTYEGARLLYVALTRAKNKLHLLTESLTARKGAFLSKIMLGGEHEFISLEPEVAQVPEFTENNKLCTRANINDLLRLSTYIHPLAKMPTTNHLDTANMLQIAGTLMHTVFQHIALIGIQHMRHQDIVNFKNWVLANIDDLKVIAVCHDILDNLLACEHAQQILRNDYVFAKTEWNLVTQASGGVQHYYIDRAYQHSDGTLWIIDYKLTQHLSRSDLLEQYSNQLYNYHDLVYSLKEFRVLRLALYIINRRELIIVN